MANQEHLDILKQGVVTWNPWRTQYPWIEPDLSGAGLSGAKLGRANFRDTDLSKAFLSGADLSKAFLGGTNLSRANLSGANLSGANLTGTNFSHAILSGANLSQIDLSGRDFSKMNLSGANFSHTTLSGANFSHAILSGANLNETNLIKTDFSHANLSNCSIYGIAAWDIRLDEQTVQKNLIITPPGQPTITVDNLKIAQFIYLLLNNAEIREVIDTITSKVVLILGRFTPERKVVLDALREELRKHNYSPILFDFEKPASRDLTGTVSILAHLARFIIVDLTDPSSAPHEVATVIPQTVVPVQPLILDGQRTYSMFRDLRQRYHWVLPTYVYTDQAHLLATLQELVIAPAEQKAQELAKR